MFLSLTPLGILSTGFIFAKLKNQVREEIYEVITQKIRYIINKLIHLIFCQN